MPISKTEAITCWTCKPLEAYVDIANKFATNLATALQAPMQLLFFSLAALWIVVTGYKILILNEDPFKFIGNLVYIIIASILLGGQGVSLIETVFKTTLDLMSSSAAVAFEVAGQKPISSDYTGLASLAASGETAIAQVFYIAGSIAKSGGLLAVVNIVYAIVLILPYFLLMIAYSAQVVVCIFRLMMLATFAPFLFMAFSFGWGQGMAKAGIKTLIAAVLVLFASTVAFSLTIYGVNAIEIAAKAPDGAKDLNAFASIANPQFITILFLGWAGAALLAEGTSIANSIAGSSLTNVAAGIMTAGMAASVGAVKGAGLATATAPFKAGGAWADAKDGFVKNAAGLQDMVKGGNAADIVERIKTANDVPPPPTRPNPRVSSPSFQPKIRPRA